MSDVEEIRMEEILKSGRKIIYLGLDSGRFVTHIGPRKDELDMKVAYIDGGKPGDYVALYNCEADDFLVGELFSTYL